MRLSVLIVAAVLAVPAGAVQGRPKSADLAPDYSHAPAMAGLYHWDHLPLTVYLTPGVSSSAARVQAVRAGLDEWAAASNGVLDYRVVDRAASADVTIRFLPGAYVPPNRDEVGRTETLARGRVLHHADTVLATSGVTLPELTEHAAHEWGHVLGIHGHSDSPDDLMYSVSVHTVYIGQDPPPETTRTVSRRDLKTIARAYPAEFRAGAAKDGGNGPNR